MAKASDNVYPYVHVAPAAAPASPASGSQRLFLDSGDGNKLKRKDSTGTVTTIEGGGGGILACTSYNPGTLANPTSTSTTLVDIDATNLIVTFTAPASGNVLVVLEGVGGNSGTTDGMSWGLRSGSSTVMPGSIVAGGSGTAVNNVFTKSFKITGLTAGTSYTYKWAWLSNTGTNTIRLFAGGVAGGANMTVYTLP